MCRFCVVIVAFMFVLKHFCFEMKKSPSNCTPQNEIMCKHIVKWIRVFSFILNHITKIWDWSLWFENNLCMCKILTIFRRLLLLLFLLYSIVLFIKCIWLYHFYLKPMNQCVGLRYLHDWKIDTSKIDIYYRRSFNAIQTRAKKIIFDQHSRICSHSVHPCLCVCLFFTFAFFTLHSHLVPCLSNFPPHSLWVTRPIKYIKRAREKSVEKNQLPSL